MQMNFFIDLGICICILMGIYLSAPVWWEYKFKYLKREMWIAFGLCPRCNNPVNFDRNGRAICPKCGRPC
jgi:predicted amidophosphoribosyltransferase